MYKNNQKMKKITLSTISLLFSCHCAAQQYDSGRLYDFGLPGSKELSHSLAIAIPCLIVGFLICWITMWGRPQSQDNPDKVTYIGCGGVLIMAVGGFFLLPLLAYVELAWHTLFIITIIICIICAIYKWIKNKIK